MWVFSFQTALKMKIFFPKGALQCFVFTSWFFLLVLETNGIFIPSFYFFFSFPHLFLLQCQPKKFVAGKLEKGKKGNILKIHY